MFMNSKKFNVYKNAVYFDIASGILLIAGLVVGLILGLNSEVKIASSSILNTTLAVLVFEIILLIYVTVKYDFYTAFTMVLAVLHNVMLTVALVCIFRIPVTDSLTTAIMIVTGLTAVNLFILFAGKPDYKSTTNRESMVNDLVSSKLKTLVLLNCTILVTVIAMIFTFNTNIVMLVRPLLIGIVVTFYSTVFMCAPFCGYFIKEKKQRKQVDLEQDYVK